MDPLVRELQIEADYGQIYIYDPATQLPAHDATEDDDPLQRALEEGNESRRFVGYAGGLIDVLTPSRFNWKAPMRIEVSHAPPESDVESWDHVVELPLPVPSGRLVVGQRRSRRKYPPAATAPASRGAGMWRAPG